MKAVILAGGLGTRISEETSTRPKPMIEIGGKPILWHILKTYSHHGINDFDTSKPDGSPRKLMDSSRLNALGWQPQVGLEAGLADTYQDFIARTTT